MLDISVRTGSEIAQPAPLDPAPRDPFCYRSRNGTLIRLPNYSPGLASTELCVQGEYQLRARSISPTRSRNRSQVRFQLDVCLRGEIVRSQRYEIGATSLTEAVEQAKVWLRQQRAIARLSFIMAPFSLLLWGLLGATSWFLFPVVSWVSLAPFFVCLTAALASAPARRQRSVTARLAGLSWDRNDFCRGWLITGDTGAGKTFAINALLHSVFQNEPDWGGLCCDEKGIYHETLVQMTRKYGRLGDLRLLQIKPDGAGDDWEPPAMFNLLSDDSIPGSTYATVIVDTASAL